MVHIPLRTSVLLKATGILLVALSYGLTIHLHSRCTTADTSLRIVNAQDHSADYDLPPDPKSGSRPQRHVSFQSTEIPPEIQSKNSSTLALLRSFSAESAPIMMGTPVPPERPVRVRILLFEHKKREISFRPGPMAAISDELLNICMDGFARSPHFDLVNWTIVPDFTLQPDFCLPEVNDDDDTTVNNNHDEIVWVADMRRIVLIGTYTISRQLVQLAQSTLAHHRARNTTPPTIRVVFMDFRDRIVSKTLCTKGVLELGQLLGRHNVRFVLQQVVRGREWSDKGQFPTGATVWDSHRDAKCFGGPILHVPYTVRSDYAEAVQQLYPSFLRYNDHDSTNTTTTFQTTPTRNMDPERTLTPADTFRPVDVAHFWGTRGAERHAKLRNSVTELLLGLQKNETNISTAERRRPWIIVADFVSSAAGNGRTNVASSYLQALLTTKIVVVAQRDHWEDHYRLFEAIVGGALVMTDPMLSLPEGLVDRTNIVVYHSLSHLQELLEYYLDPRNEDERLSIAREGWTVAMTRHRTFHWMEQIFFGRRLSA
jgi:hypothetical protein